MSKYFNWISVVISFIGGGLGYVFGGWDNMLIVLVCVMALDYLTGVLKGIYEKRLSSEIGRKGIIKKVMIIVMVGVAYLIQRAIKDAAPLRELVIAFFTANEGLSILENASVMLPIPQSLKNVLIQLREKGDKNEGK